MTTLSKQRLTSTWQGIMPNYSWTQMWKAIVSGFQENRTTLRALSHEIGTAATTKSPLSYTPISLHRCQSISRYPCSPVRSARGWPPRCSCCPWMHYYRKLGGDGSNTVNPSDATAFTWTGSPRKREFSCWELLPWLSEREDFCGNTMNVWLREQSRVPYHMWCRPSGRRADWTPPRTQIANLASFYGSSEPTKMTIPSKCSKRPYHSPSLTN